MGGSLASRIAAGGAFVLLFAGLQPHALAAAATRFVNAVSGVNTGTCLSQSSPCKTITYAMGQASAGDPGDLVSVAPGTYNIALGEVFPIVLKSGVQLVATGTAAETIIDAAGDTVHDGIVSSTSNASPAARIQGFTIRNGLKAPGDCGGPVGGAVSITDSSETFTITGNVFSTNEARGHSSDGSAGQAGCFAFGGAVAIFSFTVNITNNVFTGNIARGGNGFTHLGSPLTGNENGGEGHGGAIYFVGSGEIVNNTFYGNAAIGGNGGAGSNGTAPGEGATGGGIEASGAAIVNNVFFANAATSGSGGGTPHPATAGAMTASGTPPITNNLFFGNLVNGAASSGDTIGTFAIGQDPRFQGAPSDLHLRNDSPAKGAGSPTGAPAVDFDGTARPNPPSIGAFEASATATSTAVASNVNPSASAQSVTFTATVTAAIGTPTGTVTFKDGTTTICLSVAMVSGQAQCATSSLSPATHSITAVYTGDTTYAASTSPAFSQVVNPSTSGFTLTVSKSGNGTVTSSPTGINCGPTCAGNFASGTGVTLTATGTSGSIFAGWSGAGCSGTGTCSMILGANAAVTATFTLPANLPRLANISTRGRVLTGNDVMIAGFIIRGSTAKTVVINVAGPSLTNYGITNPLADPTITLVRSSDNAIIGTNDNWQSAANAAQIQASGFAPSNPLEPAVMMTLAPGAYTAIVQGAGGGTGTGLVGVFEVDHPEVPLINISTRGRVLTGNDVMIAGFIIQGTAPQTVIVTVAGPSLVNFGISNPLADPTLTLVRSSDGAVIAFNDNWQSAANAAQIQASGFAPSNPLEPAIMMTLPPGAYTAIVQGVGGGTGVGLVGVFAQ